MRPYLTHEHPIRFAHRGSRLLWPENTLTAFQGAIDLGCRYLEIDVHVTRDHRVVVFHDDRLERLTDGSGRVSDWLWEDLRRLDAAYHFKPEDGHALRGTGIGIPLFEDAVATWPSALWNIDLKQGGIERRVADLISAMGIEERVMIGSFRDRRIRRFRSATGGAVATSAGPTETTRALNAARLGRRPAGPADAFQVPERAGPITIVDGRFVKAAHRAGKQVHVWTVNDAGTMHRLLDLGVDGIVTDRPDVLNEVLVERGRP